MILTSDALCFCCQALNYVRFGLVTYFSCSSYSVQSLSLVVHCCICLSTHLTSVWWLIHLTVINLFSLVVSKTDSWFTNGSTFLGTSYWRSTADTFACMLTIMPEHEAQRATVTGMESVVYIDKKLVSQISIRRLLYAVYGAWSTKWHSKMSEKAVTL